MILDSNCEGHFDMHRSYWRHVWYNDIKIKHIFSSYVCYIVIYIVYIYFLIHFKKMDVYDNMYTNSEIPI